MKRQSYPILLFALAAGVGFAGCDKLGGEGGEEEKEKEVAKAEEGEESEEKAKEGEEKPKEEEGKPSEKDAEIAALKAEIAAQKEAEEAAKAADPEAAKLLEGEEVTAEEEVATEQELKEGETGPVTVANVKVEEQNAFGNPGAKGFKVFADLTVNEEKGGGVFGKMSCVSGDEVFVDVVTIGSEFGPFGDMKKDETKSFDSFAFINSGFAEAPGRCQIKFDYGSRDFSVKLAEFCLEGKEVKDGVCAEAVAPKPNGDGALVPFAFKVSTKEAPDFHNHPDSKKGDGRRSVEVSFATRFNEPLEKAPHMHVKTACKVGEKTWVEVNPDFPHVKPFTLTNGEAVQMRHNQFFLNSLPGEPEHCDMTVMLDQGFGNAEKVLADVCWVPGSTKEGRCGPKEAAGAPEALSAESITLDEVDFLWTEDFRDKNKVMLNVHLAATMAKPLEGHVQLMAQAKCDGKTDREHPVGPSLKLIDPKETVAVTMTAFRDEPFKKEAKKCEITVKAKDFFGSGDDIELAKVCLKGGKAKLGKCKGGGGKKGKGKPAEEKPTVAEENTPPGRGPVLRAAPVQ